MANYRYEVRFYNGFGGFVAYGSYNPVVNKKLATKHLLDFFKYAVVLDKWNDRKLILTVNLFEYVKDN